MSYGNDGSCCNGGGWGVPFMGNMGGFGMGMGYEWLLFILFFGMWGWGGNGGFGGFGARGLEQATTTAAETAALVGQQQVADRVASIATGVDAIAGIATANGVKLEGVKDAVTNGFFANQTNLCELGNNIAQQFNAQTLQGINNHNNLTSQLTDMRFAAQQCCCDTKQLIASSFCDLRHQMQVDKCDTDNKIAASTAAIIAKLDAAEKTAMLEKINALQEQKAGLKAQIDLQNQTNQLAAMIQQRGCAPAPACGPCGPYPYTPYYNGCCGEDLFQRVVNRAAAGRLEDVLFPAAAPTTAATAAG